MSTEKPHLGKLDRKTFERIIAPHLGSSKGLLRPPTYGNDFTAVEIGPDLTLVLSSDPLSISPQLGWKRSGRLALQVIGVDVAISGIHPRYISVNWNLPPSLEDQQFLSTWEEFVAEAEREGITIAGGHTGRYQGCEFPMVGAATAFGVGKKEDLLPAGKLQGGDKILLVNEPGLEAAAVLALYYPSYLKRHFENHMKRQLVRKFDALQPIGDMKRLAAVPGILRIHDLGEGGLLGGLQEVLAPFALGARIAEERVRLDPGVEKLCRHLNLDPLKITSLGAAIALCRPAEADKVRRGAREAGLQPEVIGEITTREEIEIRGRKKTVKLTRPVGDPFWDKLEELGN
ncbi:MAG: AIR synthase-related protein [Candidatus Acetothermia bacterium]